MARKQKHTRGNLWIFLGLLFILGAFGLTAYNIWDGYRADRAAQAVVTKLEDEIDQEPKTDTDGMSPERDMPTITIDGYRYVGYLKIPSLDLKLPVMEKLDYQRLSIAPCRYSGSVYLNNMVIGGHNYSRHFNALRYQKIGTKLKFIDAEKQVYHYKISDVEILRPDQNARLVKDSDQWDLTLFTCTIGAQSRYTVRCVRTD